MHLSCQHCTHDNIKRAIVLCGSEIERSELYYYNPLVVGENRAMSIMSHMAAFFLKSVDIVTEGK